MTNVTYSIIIADINRAYNTAWLILMDRLKSLPVPPERASAFEKTLSTHFADGNVAAITATQ